MTDCCTSPVSFQRCCSSRNVLNALIERFVTVDQFFQFFDDLEFGLVVGFFFGVQPGDELIAFLAVFGE